MKIPGSYESDGEDEPLPDPYASSLLHNPPQNRMHPCSSQPTTLNSQFPAGRASQELADAEFARKIARDEGIDVERMRMEEMDRELARKLAEEIT